MQEDSKKHDTPTEANNVLAVLPMSDYPTEASNWHWDDEWSESERVCPKCKDVKVWQAGWYDGTPDDGGACIGTKYECGKCGHYESW